MSLNALLLERLPPQWLWVLNESNLPLSPFQTSHLHTHTFSLSNTNSNTHFSLSSNTNSNTHVLSLQHTHKHTHTHTHTISLFQTLTHIHTLTHKLSLSLSITNTHTHTHNFFPFQIHTHTLTLSLFQALCTLSKSVIKELLERESDKKSSKSWNYAKILTTNWRSVKKRGLSLIENQTFSFLCKICFYFLEKLNYLSQIQQNVTSIMSSN